MQEIYKTYKHNPPHLFRSNATYFITGSTYKKVHYMKSDEAKERLLFSIYKGFNDYGWEIEDWVILNNHYHLMVNAPENAETLSNVIRDIHRFTANWINKHVSLEHNMEYNMECIDRVNVDLECIEHLPRQGIDTRIITDGSLQKRQNKRFHNYWDTCITYKKSYYARLHYIWFNPVKHGYVDDPFKWKFGSYFYRFSDEKNEIRKIIDEYPCDKVKVYDDF